MKIKPYLIAPIAALALYFTPVSTAKITHSELDIVRTNSLETRLVTPNELNTAIDNGQVAFNVSERIKLANLTIKVKNTIYAMIDGCTINDSLDECKIDDQPDVCIIIEDNILKSSLLNQEAEQFCGDLYRITKEAFLDYHVKKIEELVKTGSASIIFDKDKKGPGKVVMITDRKSARYLIFDEDGDGIIETMSLYYAANPKLPILFIERNTSESIKKKIGGLYKLINDYENASTE